MSSVGESERWSGGFLVLGGSVVELLYWVILLGPYILGIFYSSSLLLLLSVIHY